MDLQTHRHTNKQMYTHIRRQTRHCRCELLSLARPREKNVWCVKFSFWKELFSDAMNAIEVDFVPAFIFVPAYQLGFVPA
jgi:hypothetical protein